MAVTITSHLHQVLILNGHTFRKLADVERPIEIPTVIKATHKFGKDGALLATRTNHQGGELMVHLMPTSTSAKFVLRQASLIDNGANVEWTGSFNDQTNGTSILLQGGVLLECPPGTEPEGNFSIKFVFEQFVTNYDGAKFSQPPLLSNAA